MSQPASLPRWASTVQGDTTRVFQPTSGKADVGWAEGERPAEEHLNWLFVTIYLWCQYLQGLQGEALTWTAAQVFSAAATFNGSFSVPGTLSCGTLAATNDVTVADDLTVTDDASIGGDLAVAGSITIATGNLTTTGGDVHTGAVVCNTVSATGAVAGASVTASGDVTGTDLHHTAYHRRWITPLGNYTSSLGAATNWLYGTGGAAGGILNSAGGASEIIFIPIPVSEGETISLNVIYSAAVNELGFSLSRLDPNTGTGGTVGTIAITVGNGSKQSIAIATNHTAVAGCMYYLQAQNQPASGSLSLFGLELLQKR